MSWWQRRPSLAAYLVFGPVPPLLRRVKRVALADYHDKDPTGVPDELKSASVLERGEYLTRAADCVACHTAKDGVPFAGGPSFCVAVRHAVFHQHYPGC